MKKQILMWFGLLYFFVLQFFVIWYIWSVENFYILAGINLLVALFGTGLYVLIDSKKSKSMNKYAGFSKRISQMLISFMHRYAFVLSLFLLILAILSKIFFNQLGFSLWWFVGLFVFLGLFSFKSLFQRKIYFGKKLFLPKDFLFLGSIVCSLLVFWTLNIESILISVHLFLSVFVGFLFFVLWIWVFRAIWAFSIWKLVSTRLYLVLLLGSFLFLLPQWYFSVNNSQLIQWKSQFFQFTWEGILENYEKVKDRFVWEENIDPNFHEWTGEVLSSGFDITENVNFYTGVGEVLMTSGDVVLTGNTVNLSWIAITGVILESNEEIDNNVDYFPDFNADSPLTYWLVIKYLMDFYEIPLSSKTNISFTNISKTNELYPYFVTAIQYSIIWKTQKVSLNVKCDNYLVMKWILLWWDVSGYQWDIFAKYYNVAKDLWELNGCEPGSYVVKGTL